MFSTSLDQFRAKAASHERVVVATEFMADRITPVHALDVLAASRQQLILLDASDHKTSEDACVYIGMDPYASFIATNKEVIIHHDGDSVMVNESPYVALKTFFHIYRSAPSSTLAKFAGGMMGALGYEALRFEEPTVSQIHHSEYPSMRFDFYRHHVVFDKRRGTVVIATVVDVSGNIEADYKHAIDYNEACLQELHKPIPFSNTNNQLGVETAINISQGDEAFISMIEEAKTSIKKGDVFQVVLSRTFSRSFSGRDIDVYRALRFNNPSPYQFLIRYEDYSVVGSSPEQLVSLRDGLISTSPMAGTRPRGSSNSADEMLEDDLLKDPKEIAEHMMLVDLARNDIGKIAEVGSVAVPTLKMIKRFSRVMHITSEVTGQLKDDLDAFDVLRSVLPAGTLSGAPKVSAMSLIDKLESSSRDLYGGAIVAIDNQGNMDSCITIRTVQIKDGVAAVRAGCGVVFDSDPQSECEETRHKAQAVLEALQFAEEVTS